MKVIRKLFGQRLKELRKRKNLNQEQLAELAGVDVRTVSHIECGDVFPTKTLPNFATALNVEISELFIFEHIKEDLGSKKEYIKKIIDELSEEKVNIIYRLIKSMK